MTAPDLPPLLRGHAVTAGESPARAAAAGAAEGRYGAGDLLWSERGDRLCVAVVLEPEVPRRRCGEMLYLAMVAFGDAAGANIPPETAITYSWPGMLRLNGARLGTAGLRLAPCTAEAVPSWLVVDIEAAMLPPPGDTDPGRRPDDTSFWDEGCGELDTKALIESLARHLVSWLHRWETEGFGDVHRDWWARRDLAAPLAAALPGRLAGLDEHGNAVLVDASAASLDTLEVLRAGNLAPA